MMPSCSYIISYWDDIGCLVGVDLQHFLPTHALCLMEEWKQTKFREVILALLEQKLDNHYELEDCHHNTSPNVLNVTLWLSNSNEFHLAFPTLLTTAQCVSIYTFMTKIKQKMWNWLITPFKPASFQYFQTDQENYCWPVDHFFAS